MAYLDWACHYFAFAKLRHPVFRFLGGHLCELGEGQGGAGDVVADLAATFCRVVLWIVCMIIGLVAWRLVWVRARLHPWTIC